MYDLLPVLHEEKKGAILQEDEASSRFDKVDVILNLLVGLNTLEGVEGAEIRLFKADALSLQ